MSEAEIKVSVMGVSDEFRSLCVDDSQIQQNESATNVSNNSLFIPKPLEQTDPKQLVDMVGVEISNNKTGYVGPAPTLRVEKLRDEDNISLNSFIYTSEEEGGSHASDMDGDHSDRGEVKKPTVLEDFVPPDDELKTKIITQVEFYFSDANILKDAFLLKHVRRNKQGYVSIKLITSFKKVKSLTKDYRVVAFSLHSSDKLEVNSEETKVRRKDPLPEFDETTPSRSVVVVNIPFEPPTIEGIAEIFSKCGEVALIRIIRPGKSIPQDVKRYSSKHPEIGTTTCAVVEFEKHESARKACDLMTNADDWRKGMRVVLLAVHKKKDKEQGKNSELINAGGGGDQKTDISVKQDEEDGKDADKKRRKRGARKKKNRIDQLANNNESSCYSSGSEAEPTAKPQSSSLHVNQVGLDPNRLSPHSTPRSSPRSSPMSSPRSRRRGNYGKSPLLESPSSSPRPSPRSSPEMGRKRVDYSSGGDSSPSSPWVQRRMKAAQERSPLAQNGSPRGSPIAGRRNMFNMMGIVRQPVGPDGTKGFYSGKGRGSPLALSSTST